MFPTIFEWSWNMSHAVFMGGAAFAITVVSIGMTYCIIKSVLDTTRKKENGGHH